MTKINIICVILIMSVGLVKASPYTPAREHQFKTSWEPALVIMDQHLTNQLAKTTQDQRHALLASGFLLLAISLCALLLVKRSRILLKQNRIIRRQRNALESKQKEIMDSLKYAEVIQNALLKNENRKAGALPPHFIHFRPKDIVGGDFYWLTEKKGYLYLAVADCTGHGAAGALLSLLGSSFLNELMQRDELMTPAELMEALRAKFIRKLGAPARAMDGVFGMDMSLARIHMDHLTLEWSGANLSCYLVRQGSGSSGAELIELRGNRQPVGFHMSQEAFNGHSLSLRHGDRIFLSTDGIFSQFGGPRGRRFQSQQLRDLLCQSAHLNMNDQGTRILEILQEWQGTEEQVDDMCVVGLEVVQFASHLHWNQEPVRPAHSSHAPDLESAA
ncbi:MAG: PP2C family protein-serine/threonine phosphatase [Flavobacteriales bacterium]